ncbi:protein FAR1-RELATED SEQUENCE 7-like [Chenopodium quinoa]|uniref:protein FAR1-RELATED SEQUENCE 7-like n=1 Tax=Chenopodium quinoa TaxID=63459 RepID=UPI000B7703E8|nr:protein FAR1-RELATED SEQUENCE 7-like [Chenopodium quinoa]
MMRNNEHLDSHSSTIANVPTTPTIVVSPKVAPLLTLEEQKNGFQYAPMSEYWSLYNFLNEKEIVGGYDNISTAWCLLHLQGLTIIRAPFACFIANEDIVSFEWLFRSFLKAMSGNEPNCMITDQDPAMKIVVTSVCKKTEHRFCMWHIMKKLPDKVEKSIMQEETGFLKKLCACVWHLEIEPAEFEEMWNKVMVEYHLEEHEWLGYMYKIRDKWIPAYFRDVFLGGIMRTTSRSESENNFFCSFINPHVSLVEFYLRYEVAIDAQRHTQGQNDNDSKHKYLECKTPLGIEKHASHLYINSVFYEFQYEKENGLEVVKKAKRFETIPEQYMLYRWNNMALKKPIFDLGGNLLEQCDNIIDKKKLLNDLWSEIHTCVSLAKGKDEDIQDLVIHLQGIRKDLEAKRIARNNETTAGSANNKEQDIELLIGASMPTEIIVKPPKISKNKGTRVHVSNEETSKKKGAEIDVPNVETRESHINTTNYPNQHYTK